jgi:signal transduction histidine kinase
MSSGSASWRRPPWWPENEDWPPAGRQQKQFWQSHRARFFRRMGCLMALFFLLVFTGLNLIFWLVAGAFGIIEISGRSLALAIPIGLLAFTVAVLGVILIVFALRQTITPVGDIIGAANRVADGDYSVRVNERGPGEVRSLAKTFNAMVDRLETYDETRRRLLADVTHELRTPLTVVQGNLEGMIDGVYPADEGHLKSVLDETRLLSRLVNDLRTLSLVESGSLKLHFEPVDLTELLNSAAGAFRSQADSSGVNLEVQVDPNELAVEADPERIREVTENLIANALRYTPEGGSVKVSSSSGDRDRVSIIVSDTGRGIQPEDLPHIFDRFYKTSDSHGSGLGLAIARDLVEAHGGQISAESKPGVGTTIRISLPVKNPS